MAKNKDEQLRPQTQIKYLRKPVIPESPTKIPDIDFQSRTVPQSIQVSRQGKRSIKQQELLHNPSSTQETQPDVMDYKLQDENGKKSLRAQQIYKKQHQYSNSKQLNADALKQLRNQAQHIDVSNIKSRGLSQTIQQPKEWAKDLSHVHGFKQFTNLFSPDNHQKNKSIFESKMKHSSQEAIKVNGTVKPLNFLQANPYSQIIQKERLDKQKNFQFNNQIHRKGQNKNIQAIIDQTLGLKYKNLDLISTVTPIGLKSKNGQHAAIQPQVDRKPIYEIDPQRHAKHNLLMDIQEGERILMDIQERDNDYGTERHKVETTGMSHATSNQQDLRLNLPPNQIYVERKKTELSERHLIAELQDSISSSNAKHRNIKFYKKHSIPIVADETQSLSSSRSFIRSHKGGGFQVRNPSERSKELETVKNVQEVKQRINKLQANNPINSKHFTIKFKRNSILDDVQHTLTKESKDNLFLKRRASQLGSSYAPSITSQAITITHHGSQLQDSNNKQQANDYHHQKMIRNTLKQPNMTQTQYLSRTKQIENRSMTPQIPYRNVHNNKLLQEFLADGKNPHNTKTQLRLKEGEDEFDSSRVVSSPMADEIYRLGNNKQAVTFLKKNQFYGKQNQNMNRTLKAKSPLERLIQTNFRSTATSKVNSFNRPGTMQGSNRITTNPKTSSPENASTEQTSMSKHSKNRVLTIPLHKIIKNKDIDTNELVNQHHLEQFEQKQAKDSVNKKKHDSITMSLYNKKLVDDEKAKYKEYLDFMLNVKNSDKNGGGTLRNSKAD